MKDCPKCGNEFDPGKWNKKFCSRKCANSRTFTEESKEKKSISQKKYYCENGVRPSKLKGIPVKEETLVKRAKTWIEKSLDEFYEGEIKDRSTIKKLLIHLYGHKCVCCGLSEWRNNKIPLQVDHINGNAGNNKPDNVQLLCPNCHSQTDTWCGKNKGNGRGCRGLPTW